ncbi:MAG: hypothetical protein ACKVT1_09425 [Dehalococcoidia bacterium]
MRVPRAICRWLIRTWRGEAPKAEDFGDGRPRKGVRDRDPFDPDSPLPPGMGGFS